MLRKNKKSLAIDPARRELSEALRAEYNGQVGKLLPLLERIEKTDGLIDLIVYRLHRLTEENITPEANVQFQWMECVKHLSRKNVCVFLIS